MTLDFSIPSMQRFSVGQRSRRLAAIVCAGLLAACSPERLVHSDPPSTIIPVSALGTPAGAMALYTGAIDLFNSMYGGGGTDGSDTYIMSSGLLADEYVAGPFNSVFGNVLDPRRNSETFATGSESVQALTYSRIQNARTAALQARQALKQFGPEHSDALIGRMYALEAYTIVFLGEYFCDGVPLSTTALFADPVYAAGSSTTELFTAAVALFDTALTLTGDSTRYTNLAKVGKGRALLNLARFAEAAMAVQDVPLTFVYAATFKSGAYVRQGNLLYFLENGLSTPDQLISTGGYAPGVSVDREGQNGLMWTTDPRTRAVTDQFYSGGYPWVTKYATGNSPIRLADGLEASLIRAEAAFQANPEGTAWLDTLNSLRANCTSASGCAPVDGITADSLPALPDSGTSRGRLLEIMSERAHWLFATGHRQGDLRRQLRPPYSADPYNRTPDLVYPTGAYVAPNVFGTPPVKTYGFDVVAIVPRAEQQYNRKYSGCFDLNA